MGECFSADTQIMQDVLPAWLWLRLLVVLVFAAKYVSNPTKCRGLPKMLASEDWAFQRLCVVAECWSLKTQIQGKGNLCWVSWLRVTSVSSHWSVIRETLEGSTPHECGVGCCLCLLLWIAVLSATAYLECGGKNVICVWNSKQNCLSMIQWCHVGLGWTIDLDRNCSSTLHNFYRLYLGSANQAGF